MGRKKVLNFMGDESEVIAFMADCYKCGRAGKVVVVTSRHDLSEEVMFACESCHIYLGDARLVSLVEEVPLARPGR